MQSKIETKPSMMKTAANYIKNADAMKKVQRLQDLVKQQEAELKLFKHPTAPEQYAASIADCTNKIKNYEELILYTELLQNPLFDSIKDSLYKIIAEYVVIRVGLECKRVKSIVALLSFLGTEIAYLNSSIAKVRSNTALAIIEAKRSECLWMTALCHKVELCAQITQFSSAQEDGYSSITMKNWKEIKVLLKKTIVYFKEINKNNAYPATIEHLEKIADELCDLASIIRTQSLATAILDEAAVVYEAALYEYITSPDKKYAEIAMSLCLVYYKKIEVFANVNSDLNHEQIIKQHEKIIDVAESVAEATQINHATIVNSKMEARAYLFTSYYYLYQQETDKAKEDGFRAKFLDNAREFIGLAATEILSSELKKCCDDAQKAIAQYNNEYHAAGNKCCHSATKTTDPKIKEALLKEAIKQFEIAATTNKKGEIKINSYAALCDAYSEMLKVIEPAQHKEIYTAILNITKLAAAIKEYTTCNRTLHSDIAKINACAQRCNEYFKKEETAAATNSATASPEYEKTSKTSKANARKAMPSAVGIFSDQGTKKRKTTDTRKRAESTLDAGKNGTAKLSAATN